MSLLELTPEHAGVLVTPRIHAPLPSRGKTRKSKSEPFFTQSINGMHHEIAPSIE